MVKPIKIYEMNETVTGMDEYKVRIGHDLFNVWAADNQRARYEAASLFREKHNSKARLTDIASHAKAKLITDPEEVETSEEVLKSTE